MKKIFLTCSIVLVFLTSCVSCSCNSSKPSKESTNNSSSNLSYSAEASSAPVTDDSSTSSETEITSTSTSVSSDSDPMATKITSSTEKTKKTKTTKKTEDSTKKTETQTKKTTTKQTESTTQKKTTTKAVTTTVTTKQDATSLEDVVKYPIAPLPAEYQKSAASLACIEMALNYWNIPAKQSDMLNYLDISNDVYVENGDTFIPDPTKYFIGDPKSTTMGSSTEPIFNMLQKYISANNYPIECRWDVNDISIMRKNLDNDCLLIVFFGDKNDFTVYSMKIPDSNNEIANVNLPNQLYSAVVLDILPNNSLVLSCPQLNNYLVMDKETWENMSWPDYFVLKKT